MGTTLFHQYLTGLGAQGRQHPDYARLSSKIRACLLGGAAGDALGYTVEFWDIDRIRRKYGPDGIAAYEPVEGFAIFSDDTQMTLFTAEGLILGYWHGVKTGRLEPELYIYPAYISWLRTQGYKVTSPWDKVSNLMGQKRLFRCRAPGNTCLSALCSGKMGTIEKPLNNSKGCGGVMRVAPVGFLPFMSASSASVVAARAAAITHGHPMGYIPAAMLADMIERLLYGNYTSLYDVVVDSRTAICQTFSRSTMELSAFRLLIEKAISLSKTATDDVEAIHSLGGGWVGDEALAIATYCALKYEHDFDRCMRAAVNHSGDADSTGAIAGNILGAHLGMDAIGEKYLKELEMVEDITAIGEKVMEIICHYAKI